MHDKFAVVARINVKLFPYPQKIMLRLLVQLNTGLDACMGKE